MLAGLFALAATPAQAAPRLRAFDSCAGLVRYAAAHAPPAGRIGVIPPPSASGTPDGAPSAETQPSAAPDVSQTNVQEAGIDEPDIVKTDGRTLFVIGRGRLQAIDAAAAPARLLGSVALPAGGDHQLLLHEGRALVISRAQDQPFPLPRPVRPGPGAPVTDVLPPYQPPQTVLTEVDVRDPAAMRVVRTMTVDGLSVGARLHGATARVVVSSSPRGYVDPVARARAAGWMPRATLRRGTAGAARTRRLLPCRAVRRPRAFAGAGMLSVLTIDLERGLPAVDADALMTDGDTVYASAGSLYVATRRYAPSPADATVGATTSIHRFDTSDPRSTTYAASGSVPGALLGQFSLSEDGGVLRAASTGDGGDAQQSFVTTLAQRDGRLTQLGQVGGIGRGERIHAVRFIGPVGYVVTFRQTDPLFTIDLSDPAAPRVAGELELLGYSAYLHPVGDGRLLGVGRDATAGGRLKGAQASLFDVSDPAQPRRLAQHALGSADSAQAEYDHHAFLWWPATRLAVLPLTGEDPGALGLRLGDGEIAEVGRIAHAGSPVDRVTVVGDRLFALCGDGVVVASLDSLAERGFVAFGAAR
ncbi:hypothetical protein DSM104329_01163 [Capillimicrobium parvum]|uniref:Beta propeller domain-containing protein n=2 Tax=Capillimicrobium parvum TaxID=2884022 RepID=A0A9E6XUS1_9ACTN|nr:hypothetical protein DSM104329_01163 [Capillimicrobium parvum]